MSTPIFCSVGELWEVHDTACDSNCNYCTCTAGHSRFCRYWTDPSRVSHAEIDVAENGDWLCSCGTLIATNVINDPKENHRSHLIEVLEAQ